MKTFRKILIANRGEIAARIMRSCHDMGIATVAVYSDADADAPFVRQADEAFRLGPAPSAESYLLGDAIIAVAKRCQADAIHPGYGFLAENAEFARACADAGICFIGPSPEAIALLGSKQASKEIVAKAGVPIVPSYDLSAPEEIRYPILLKASAGGGGKGMHIVRSADELAPALESAKRIATAAFGDDTILIETYVESPRHIEIQILGDHHGTLLHLFERECSVQRRHQKIIEESPAPNLDPALRDAIAEAAVKVGQAAGYANAGTVEFIVAPSGEFYFLEVNTRLQVEHPVTESVTGIDLVREQVRVAQGEALGYTQAELHQRGAAIECRLYAEDCDNDYLPCSGTIADFHVAETPGLRMDSGVESGSEITIHYDPMLAKVITSGRTRQEALARMDRALSGLCVLGTTTNREFLLRVIRSDSFTNGKVHTNTLSEQQASLAAEPPSESALAEALLAATLASYSVRDRSRTVLPSMRPGFRNSRWRDASETYLVGDRELTVHYRQEGLGLLARVGDGEPVLARIVGGMAPGNIDVQLGDHRRKFRVAFASGCVFVQSGGVSFELREKPRFPDRRLARAPGSCVAPMPGKVVQVLAENGAVVSEGDTLLILEAMKMEHRIVADQDGTVAGLDVQVGDQVQGEQVLAVVAPGA